MTTEVTEELVDGMQNEEDRLKCPECGGEFSSPLPVYGKDGMSRGQSVIAHACPFCDTELSEYYTRLQNIRECAHSPTTNVHGDDGVWEICQNCGGKFDINHQLIGIKKEWAVPPN